MLLVRRRFLHLAGAALALPAAARTAWRKPRQEHPGSRCS
jgi:hypothetical protein